MTLGNPPAEMEVDPGIVNLYVRLFAITDHGLAVMDERPQSQTYGTNRSDLASLDDLEGKLVAMLRFEDLPSEHRKMIWQPLLDELSKIFNIQSDPETLQSLPFELVPVRAVRNLFSGDQ